MPIKLAIPSSSATITSWEIAFFQHPFAIYHTSTNHIFCITNGATKNLMHLLAIGTCKIDPNNEQDTKAIQNWSRRSLHYGPASPSTAWA
jgi:hypothetical protein